MECISGWVTGYACTARRNNALSTSNRMFAFGFTALVTVVIALAFARLGAWLILPFAGIRLLELCWRIGTSSATHRITSV
jgi:uncharacterized membrane protein